MSAHVHVEGLRGAPELHVACCEAVRCLYCVHSIFAARSPLRLQQILARSCRLRLPSHLFNRLVSALSLRYTSMCC